jgi:large subunit ribosomal protein L35
MWPADFAVLLHLPVVSALSRLISNASLRFPTVWLLKGCHGGVTYRSERTEQMPKMKTKSAAKKRFRFTASGLVKAGGAGKRHGMIKRSNKQIRNQRGTMILAPGDEGLVKIHMPYAGKY